MGGGSLYNPIGKVSRELLEQQGIFHEGVHINENFWDEIKDWKFEECVDLSSLLKYL